MVFRRPTSFVPHATHWGGYYSPHYALKQSLLAYATKRQQQSEKAPTASLNHYCNVLLSNWNIQLLYRSPIWYLFWTYFWILIAKRTKYTKLQRTKNIKFMSKISIVTAINGGDWQSFKVRWKSKKIGEVGVKRACLLRYQFRRNYQLICHILGRSGQVILFPLLFYFFFLASRGEDKGYSQSC